MSVLNIRKAKREGARLVIGLAGISGGGKTRTAIELAYGLANFNPEKIGFLDTENKRGSLYSEVLRDNTSKPTDVEFWIGDLDAPFSPQRYIDAIKQFEELGVEVLIIDSVTHEWEGTGGCEEIATLANPLKPQWNRAKAEHKRFMNALLQSNMHIIVCIRAREKVKLVKVNGKTEYEPQGVMPVTEKNFMFEMTASMTIWSGGKQREVTKSGDGTAEIFGAPGWHDGLITSEQGKALRDWIDGAKQLDPAVEKWRNSLRGVTEKGVAYTKECWGKTPAKVRKALGQAFHDTIIASAQAFEKHQAESVNQDAANVDELNQSVLGADNQQ